jgi:hypothetical protein
MRFTSAALPLPLAAFVAEVANRPEDSVTSAEATP